MSATINFYNQDNPYSLKQKTIIKRWLIDSAKKEGFSIKDLNYIFCSDDYLLSINQEHLKHDYYTDIISFDYTEKQLISGDIFISIDRVKDNAKTYNQEFIKELYRVMIHGVLHFMGYKDKTTNEKQVMRAKEDAFVALLSKGLK
jgi:probable rRNA maturation factor